jgi:hypothetical protein
MVIFWYSEPGPAHVPLVKGPDYLGFVKYHIPPLQQERNGNIISTLIGWWITRFRAADGRPSGYTVAIKTSNTNSIGAGCPGATAENGGER